MITPNDLKMDRKTEIRVKRLAKTGYQNPIERANFEKLPLNELQKILYIANKVKTRRLNNKESVIKSNPITIKNTKDAWKFANLLVDNAIKEESLHSGLMGEAVLVATYSQLPMEKLDIQILELNKEIKRKKERVRVLLNAGNVDKLVNSAIPIANERNGQPDI